MSSFIRTMTLVLCLLSMTAGIVGAGVPDYDFGALRVTNIAPTDAKLYNIDSEHAFGFTYMGDDVLVGRKVVDDDVYPLPSLDIMPNASQMAVDGSLLYILHDRGTGDFPKLTIVTAAVPTNPTIIYEGNFSPSGQLGWNVVNGIAVSDGFLWAMINQFPVVFDVSNPFQPIYVASGPYMADYAWYEGNPMAVMDGYVFFADEEAGDIVMRSFPVDPADNTFDNQGLLEPATAFAFDHTNYNFRGMTVRRPGDLFVTQSNGTGSWLTWLRSDGDGTLTEVTEEGGPLTLKYSADQMAAEGNYLYTNYPGYAAFDLRNDTIDQVGIGVALGYNLNLYGGYLFGSEYGTARVEDTPVMDLMGLEASQMPDVEIPGNTLLTFEWFTEHWTDPHLDMVGLMGCTGNCSQTMTSPLYGSSSQVDATCTYDEVSGKFRHVFKHSTSECYEFSTYTAVAFSSRAGAFGWSMDTLNFRYCTGTMAGKSQAAPVGVVLDAASPNPFNPQTTLRFHIPDGTRSAELTVHDVSGRVVKRLDVNAAAGWQQSVWTGRDEAGERVPSGVYFARLATDQGVSQVQKLMMIK